MTKYSKNWVNDRQSGWRRLQSYSLDRFEQVERSKKNMIPVFAKVTIEEQTWLLCANCFPFLLFDTMGKIYRKKDGWSKKEYYSLNCKNIRQNQDFYSVCQARFFYFRLTLNKTERLPWGCSGVTYRNIWQNSNK